MTPERIQYLVIKDGIEKLPPEGRAKVDEAVAKVRAIIDGDSDGYGMMAVVYICAEIAARSEG